MNENFVTNFENATISFCNVFEECEDKITSYKKQIDDLQQEINKNEQLYKLGNGQKAKDITAESIFTGLSDADRMNLSTTANNDRIKAVDAAGNLIHDYNLLDNETKLYFEEQAKSMRKERNDIKDQVNTTKASLQVLDAELRAAVANNFSSLLKEQMKFNSAVADISSVKSDYDDEIRKCNRNKKNIVNDARLTHEERIQKVNEQEDKRKKALAGKSVCNALDKVSDVYTEAFTQVLNAIDPNRLTYQVNVSDYLAQENRNMIEDEMNILNRLNDLISAFKQIENNYDQVKDLVAEIKDQTKKFSKIHNNGSEFVATVNKATSAVSSAIKEVENANGLENIQSTGGPTQPPQTPQTPPQTPPAPQTPPQTPPTPTGGPSGNTGNGNGGQTGDPIVDATEEAIRIRSVRESRLHSREKKTLLTAAAALGLGLVTGSTALPLVAAALGGVGLATLAFDAGSGLIDRIREGCVNHKFKKVAKKTTKLLRKGNKQSKVKVFPQADENGVLKFYVKDGDDITVIDSNLVADIDGRQLTDYMNDQLNKTFRYINDADKKKDTRYETLPNVTVDQLNSPYVEFGGYKKGLENQQYAMLGRMGANAKNMVRKFAERFGTDDLDASEVDDDDYSINGGGDAGDDGSHDPNPPQNDNPMDPLIDHLASTPEFAGFQRSAIEGALEFLSVHFGECSDELKSRIAELAGTGMMTDATGAQVPYTPDALQQLIDDVGNYLSQPGPVQQPTADFDVNDALMTLSTKYGASYPIDDLKDCIEYISLNYDNIQDADLKRKILETLTQGMYNEAGVVVDVTPGELDALVTAMNVDLGITGPVPQP